MLARVWRLNPQQLLHLLSSEKITHTLTHAVHAHLIEIKDTGVTGVLI